MTDSRNQNENLEEAVKNVDLVLEATPDVLDNPTDYISDDEKQQALEGGTGLPDSFDLRNVDTDGDGIEPDIAFTKADSFFDRKALAEYINNLK